jgi:hypothetical protein
MGLRTLDPPLRPQLTLAEIFSASVLGGGKKNHYFDQLSGDSKHFSFFPREKKPGARVGPPNVFCTPNLIFFVS